MGVGQAGDPFGRGGGQDPVAVVGGGDPQAGGQVGLAGAGRSEQHDVAGLGEEPAGGQSRDLLAEGWSAVRDLREGYSRRGTCVTQPRVSNTCTDQARTIT
jgi:hypothetical protein